jgi:hypothetical protein
MADKVPTQAELDLIELRRRRAELHRLSQELYDKTTELAEWITVQFEIAAGNGGSKLKS